MIYIDSSCLVALLREEPESDNVRLIIETEPEVIISSLAELEVEIEMKAAYLGGDVRLSQYRHFQARFVSTRNLDPFGFRTLSSGVFGTALRQNRTAHAAHCRTLDRLHLAAMQELSIRRLLTSDFAQAKAVRSLSYEAVMPVRS